MPRTPKTPSPRTPTPRTPSPKTPSPRTPSPPRVRRTPPKTAKKPLRGLSPRSSQMTKKAKRCSRVRFSSVMSEQKQQVDETFTKLNAIIDGLRITEESDYYIAGSMAVFLYTLKYNPALLPKLLIPDDVDLVKFNERTTKSGIPSNFKLKYHTQTYQAEINSHQVQFKKGQTLQLKSNPEYEVDYILEAENKKSKTTITPTIINVNGRNYKVQKFEKLKNNYESECDNSLEKRESKNNASKLSVLGELNSIIPKNNNSNSSSSSRLNMGTFGTRKTLSF